MGETDRSKERNRPDLKDRFRGIPADVAQECREISSEIRLEQHAVREDKVIAAKFRIENDYYNSDNVLRIVASRLLSESRGF